MIKLISEILERAKAEESFSLLIDHYYKEYGFEKWSDEDDIEELWPFIDEQTSPVEERSSGICEAINELLDAGYSIDDEYNLMNALMCAVGNADPHMTEYLIRKGADPTKWAGYDETESREEESNWYLEDTDLAFFDELINNEPDINLLQALADTVHVLVDCGGLKDYRGRCIDVDEKGKIDIHLAEMKF